MYDLNNVSNFNLSLYNVLKNGFAEISKLVSFQTLLNPRSSQILFEIFLEWNKFFEQVC